MKQQLVERRTELLKMEGMGFNRSEIEKVLSEKHQVSRRSVGYDFERRSVWQPQLTGNYEARKAYCKIENLLLQAYRDASFGYMHGQTENGKVGFLNVRLHVIDSLAELYGVLNNPQNVGPDTIKCVASWKNTNRNLKEHDEALKAAVELNLKEYEAVLEKASDLNLNSELNKKNNPAESQQ